MLCNALVVVSKKRQMCDIPRVPRSLRMKRMPTLRHSRTRTYAHPGFGSMTPDLLTCSHNWPVLVHQYPHADGQWTRSRMLSSRLKSTSTPMSRFKCASADPLLGEMKQHHFVEHRRGMGRTWSGLARLTCTQLQIADAEEVCPVQRTVHRTLRTRQDNNEMRPY
jgi:hypothetical protein